MHTTFSNRDAPWDLSATDALWRSEVGSDIPLQAAPTCGASYPIKLTHANASKDDSLNIEFTSAVAFFNGIESREDIDQILICKGALTDIEDYSIPQSLFVRKQREAIFRVDSCTQFNEFENFEAKEIVNDDWGYEFLNGYCRVSISRIDKYILVRWAMESAAGEGCLLLPHGQQFYALYLESFSVGSPGWVGVGNLKTPSMFTKRLSDRLQKMGSCLHWSGDKF